MTASAARHTLTAIHPYFKRFFLAHYAPRRLKLPVDIPQFMFADSFVKDHDIASCITRDRWITPTLRRAFGQLKFLPADMTILVKRS